MMLEWRDGSNIPRGRERRAKQITNERTRGGNEQCLSWFLNPLFRRTDVLYSVITAGKIRRNYGQSWYSASIFRKAGIPLNSFFFVFPSNTSLCFPILHYSTWVNSSFANCVYKMLLTTYKTVSEIISTRSIWNSRKLEWIYFSKLHVK